MQEISTTTTKKYRVTNERKRGIDLKRIYKIE